MANPFAFPIGILPHLNFLKNSDDISTVFTNINMPCPQKQMLTEFFENSLDIRSAKQMAWHNKQLLCKFNKQRIKQHKASKYEMK